MAATKTRKAKRTKAQHSRKPYLESSIGIMEGSGSHGAKHTPFNYERAVRQFMGWVYTATMLNANAAASVPLNLYVRKRKGMKLYNTKPVSRYKKNYFAGQDNVRPSKSVMAKVADFNDDYEEVTEPHPAIELLKSVNPWMNGYDLATMRFVYLQLTGNAYIHPVINGGIPSELWMMPPQWVEIIPGESGSDVFIEGYLYGKESRAKQPFAADEVIQFKLPNPRDLFYGLGKVEAGWNVISQDNAVHVMDLALYQNHARPDYAVIVKSGYSDKAFKRRE